MSCSVATVVKRSFCFVCALAVPAAPSASSEAPAASIVRRFIFFSMRILPLVVLSGLDQMYYLVHFLSPWFSGSSRSPCRPPMAADRPLVGLIGAKIGRSIPPAMHEAAGRSLGIELRYHLIDTDLLGHGAAELPRLLDSVRLLGFAGVNVTHPFKEAVVACLDAVEGPAAAVGSVNTVVVRGGQMVGH